VSTPITIVVIGILFLLKFFFGFWLNRSGKPYSDVILTIHKLISLGTGVFIVVTARRLRQGVRASTAETGALIVTIFLFLLAIVTGGLLSVDKSMPKVVSLIHLIPPFLAVLSTAVMIYLWVWAK
jgi:hypothetical protein